MLILLVLVWIALLFVLLRALYRAFKKRKTVEAVVLLCIAAVIITFTGEYALFFAWSAGCEAGLPLGCVL